MERAGYLLSHPPTHRDNLPGRWRRRRPDGPSLLRFGCPFRLCEDTLLRSSAAEPGANDTGDVLDFVHFQGLANGRSLGSRGRRPTDVPRLEPDMKILKASLQKCKKDDERSSSKPAYTTPFSSAAVPPC